MTSWFGLARPSGRTAVASPQTSPQPLVAEPTPPPPHEVGGPAVGRAVPALHRQDGEPVRHGRRPADAVVHLDGVAERPLGSTSASTGMSMPSPCRWRGARRSSCRQPLDLGDPHRRASRRSAMSARTARSASGRRGTPGGVASVDAQPRSSRNMAGVVAVGRHRRAEGELAEVLEHVVELVEGRVALRPGGRARRTPRARRRRGRAGSPSRT